MLNEISTTENEMLKPLNGLVASMSPNLIVGTAFVLLDFEKVSDFPAGAILVTSQTSPECVSAMEKSLAVLTERGGILCHAAVVSRDMNIPCIVGVKSLLDHVRTGMQISVDTTNGTVTINKK